MWSLTVMWGLHNLLGYWAVLTRFLGYFDTLAE